MPTYRFTGDLPLHLFGLSYGPGVTVTNKDGDQVNGPDGATVTINPGDIIITPDAYDSAWLVEFDSPPAPATVKDLKAALDAAGISYPSDAKKPHLQDLVASLPSTDPGQQPASDGHTPPAENEDADASEHSED